MNPREFIQLNLSTVSTDGDLQEECNNTLTQDDKVDVGVGPAVEGSLNGNAHRCKSSNSPILPKAIKENDQEPMEQCKHRVKSQMQSIPSQCCLHGVAFTRPASRVKKKTCNSSRHKYCNEDVKASQRSCVPTCRRSGFIKNCMTSSTCSPHYCEGEKESREQMESFCKGGIKRRRCGDEHTWPSSRCPHEVEDDLLKRTKGTQTPLHDNSEHDYSKTMDDHNYSDMSVNSNPEADRDDWEFVNLSINGEHGSEKCNTCRATTVDRYLDNVLRRDNTACNHLDKGDTEDDSSDCFDECSNRHHCGHPKILNNPRGSSSQNKTYCKCQDTLPSVQQHIHCKPRAVQCSHKDESSNSENDCNERHCKISRAECNDILCTSKHNGMPNSSLHQGSRCSNDKFIGNSAKNDCHASSSNNHQWGYGSKQHQLFSCLCCKKVDPENELNRIFSTVQNRSEENRACRFDSIAAGNARNKENERTGCGTGPNSGSILPNAERWVASLGTSGESNQRRNELPESYTRPRPEPKKSNLEYFSKFSIFNKIQKLRCSVLHEKDPLSLDVSSSSCGSGESTNVSQRQTRNQKKSKPVDRAESNDDDADYDDDDDEEEDAGKNGHDPKRKSKIRRLPSFQTPFRSKRTRNRMVTNAGKQSKKKKQTLPMRLEMLLDMPPVPHEVQLNHSWNPDDSSTNMKVVEGNRLICKRDPVAQSTDCIRCRVGYQQGIHLFEVSWPTKERGTHASIGVSTIEAPIHKEGYYSLVGDNEHSWGWELMKRITYHRAQNTQDNDAEYPSKELQYNFAKLEFNAETVVTIPETFRMVLNMEEGTLGFMNGDLYLGHAFTGLKGKRLFPMVSAVWGHCEITLRYLGGIDAGPLSLMDISRHNIRKEIGQEIKKLLTAQNLRRLGLPATLQKFLVYA